MSKIPVFDIGDTLIPSSENINQAVNQQLEKEGIEEKPFFPINEFNIYKVEDVQAWLDKHGIDADAESIRDAYLDWKDDYFKRSGILKELKKLNEEYGPIGFISDNSLEAREYYTDVFERHGLDYSGFVVSEQVGAEKPDPAIFKAFLDERTEPAEKFVYFGNYVERDRGAKKVGMGFVWVKKFHTFDSETDKSPQIQNLSYKTVKELLEKISIGNGDETKL